MDELFPRLPMQALKGVFAKTHLVTLLQLLKGGHLSDLVRSVPALAVAMGTSQGAADATATSHGADSAVPASIGELLDVLENGIYMHISPGG